MEGLLGIYRRADPCLLPCGVCSLWHIFRCDSNSDIGRPPDCNDLCVIRQILEWLEYVLRQSHTRRFEFDSIFTQFVAMAVYTTCVLAMGDDNNAPPGAGMSAFVVGLLVFVICTAFPYNSGACFSPARDFALRVAVAILWRKTEMFTDRAGWWFWGCWVAPSLG